MNSILLLLQFFTRIPVVKDLDYSQEAFKKSQFFFFLLALISSLPVYFIGYLGQINGKNTMIFSFMSLIVWILVTGAFHLDGFSDSCDGLFSGRSKERILEIMKDSRVGSYGVIGIFMDLALKLFILYSLIHRGRALLIPLVFISGKVSLLLNGYLGKAAKESSSGNVFIENKNLYAVLLNIIVMLISGYLFNSFLKTIGALLGIIIFTLVFHYYTHRTIGGLVGDNLGFSNEVGEIIIGIFLIWN